ncbi:MAG: glutamate--tRNA ligase [Nitrospirae bacterium]|nr:glutamate--tRNA ligase [Nitrospirota bacterium]
MTVRVRFAPSPTGYLHIGGVRTALFNYLFARHNKCKFILRIEDTDRSRSTEESINAIIEGMKWLGLDWDEGPFRQTDRLNIYKEYAEKLLSEGKAYYCYCTPEELEQRRKEALAKGAVPKYDGRCRELKEPPADRKPAIRFKTPKEGQIIVDDLIKGRVVFDNIQLDDLIIMRSDGIPTYNFTVVIDDATMGITHVIRGDDHLNNTPRQVNIYNALGYPIPKFGHLPMILGSDKTRLSKRHGATSVMAYKEMGYLPEAMINYLVRLGWSYKDEEIFSIEGLIEKFSLESVGKAAAVFNPEKLLWLNSHYINVGDPNRLAKLLMPFLINEGIIKTEEDVDIDYLARAVASLKERNRTLVELANSARYFLTDDIKWDEKAVAKFLTPENKLLLKELIERLKKVEPFNHVEIEKAFNELKDEKGLKLGQIAQPCRVAITGSTVSPGIFEVIEIIGKDRIIKRLDIILAS